ncbi:unnamed protein product, partial [Ranitomeya imitator]
EQYRLEGISWSNINYTDNERCINLISKRPTGLIQLLDEESNFPTSYSSKPCLKRSLSVTMKATPT